MFDSLQMRVRRGTRRAVFAGLAVLCAVIGAGFASFASYAGLREAGLSPALAGLILACLWFGFSGICLIIRQVIGDESSGSYGNTRNAEFYAHQGEDAAQRNGQTPPLAQAFSAGLAEGSAFASRRKAH